MANPTWDGIKGFFTIAAGTAVDAGSTSLNVPDGTSQITFYIPALTATATLRLQSLSLVDGTTWADVKYLSDAGTLTTPAPFVAAGGVVVLPAYMVGGGTIRLAVGVTTQLAAVSVGVVFNGG